MNKELRRRHLKTSQEAHQRAGGMLREFVYAMFLEILHV